MEASKVREVPRTTKAHGSNTLGKDQRTLHVKRARGTHQRWALQNMAQSDSSSSNLSSSSESGWKCRALAPFSTKRNNDSPQLIPCGLDIIERLMTHLSSCVTGPGILAIFTHFWEKGISTRHHIPLTFLSLLNKAPLSTPTFSTLPGSTAENR